MRNHRGQLPLELRIEAAQALQRGAEHEDFDPQSQESARGIDTQRPATQDHHFSGRNARHAVEQHPASAVIAHQQCAGNIRRHAPGHLTHRLEDGIIPPIGRNHLISHQRRLLRDQRLQLCLRRRHQPQKTHDNLPRMHPGDFFWRGAQHFEDQIRFGIEDLRFRDHHGAIPLVIVVIETSSASRAAFEIACVPGSRQQTNARRNQPNAIFAACSFLGNSNVHKTHSLKIGNG